MHVTILTIGSRGDVQPFMALGVGLQQARHKVRLATHADFKPMIQARGLEFAPVRGALQEVNHNPEMMTDMALKALAKTGQRGILLTRWSGISNTDLPDQVLKLESLPYDWLFPFMGCVVHDGGAGTTAAGLRAGVPTIVIPLFKEKIETMGNKFKEIENSGKNVKIIEAILNESINCKQPWNK